MKINKMGWTDIPSQGDGRTIYVSTSGGSDSKAGSSPDTAVRTIARGDSFIRDGHGDHMLLSGTFAEPLGRWVKSGESHSNPILIGSYGGGRAKIRCGADVTPIFFNGGGGAPPSFAHVAFIGLDLEPVGRSGGENVRGVEFVRPVDDILFEDCRIAQFSTNVVVQDAEGPCSNVRLRRCQILDAWSTGSEHSQGLYTSGVSGLSFFECIFDHNGYGSAVGDAGADKFRHNIYLNNGPAALASTLDGCVISRASSHGAQMRAGGKVTACLFTDNSIALLIGGGNDPHPDGVPAMIRGSLFLNGKDITASERRGWGITLSNINGGTVTGNALAHNKGGSPSGIDVDGDTNAFGVENLSITKNVIHDWRAGLDIHGAAQNLRHVTESSNSVEQVASKYVDATKNIPAGHIALLREMSKANWNPKMWPLGGLNRGILAGYALK